MSKHSIHTVKAASRRLIFIGGDSTCGTYVLRLRLNAPATISCGRFKSGKLIAFEAGDYVYVGSAMGKDRSAICLARRLVRHATRLGDHEPHLIRELMLAEFPRIGLSSYKLMPISPTKPKWNVDHVLDQPCTDLIDGYLIRTPDRAEASIGKFLEMDAATAVIEPGLGANDINGNTHLLRASGEEEWWGALPQKLRTVTQLASVHGDMTVRNALEGVRSAGWSVTAKNVATLTRMTRERAADILHRLATGCPFTRAERDSQGVFDTTGWHEIKSRLARGRGSVQRTADALHTRLGVRVTTNEQRHELSQLAKQLKQATSRLRRNVNRVAGRGRKRAVGEPIGTHLPKKRTARQFAGNLKRCIKYIVKSNRDLPGLTVSPTDRERDCIHADLALISAASDRLMKL